MSTPNGKRAQIMLEELAETYGTKCACTTPSLKLADPVSLVRDRRHRATGPTAHDADARRPPMCRRKSTRPIVMTLLMRSSWFLKICPNGRIPASRSSTKASLTISGTA